MSENKELETLRNSAQSKGSAVNELVMPEMLLTQDDIENDCQTLNLYPEKAKTLCTCGVHAPPPGLVDNPKCHIPACCYRAELAISANKPVNLLKA